MSRPHTAKQLTHHPVLMMWRRHTSACRSNTGIAGGLLLGAQDRTTAGRHSRLCCRAKQIAGIHTYILTTTGRGSGTSAAQHVSACNPKICIRRKWPPAKRCSRHKRRNKNSCYSAQQEQHNPQDNAKSMCASGCDGGHHMHSTDVSCATCCSVKNPQGASKAKQAFLKTATLHVLAAGHSTQHSTAQAQQAVNKPTEQGMKEASLFRSVQHAQ